MQNDNRPMKQSTNMAETCDGVFCGSPICLIDAQQFQSWNLCLLTLAGHCNALFSYLVTHSHRHVDLGTPTPHMSGMVVADRRLARSHDTHLK